MPVIDARLGGAAVRTDVPDVCGTQNHALGSLQPALGGPHASIERCGHGEPVTYTLMNVSNSQRSDETPNSAKPSEGECGDRERRAIFMPVPFIDGLQTTALYQRCGSYTTPTAWLGKRPPAPRTWSSGAAVRPSGLSSPHSQTHWTTVAPGLPPHGPGRLPSPPETAANMTYKSHKSDEESMTNEAGVRPLQNGRCILHGCLRSCLCKYIAHLA